MRMRGLSNNTCQLILRRPIGERYEDVETRVIDCVIYVTKAEPQILNPNENKD